MELDILCARFARLMLGKELFVWAFSLIAELQVSASWRLDRSLSAGLAARCCNGADLVPELVPPPLIMLDSSLDWSLFMQST